MMDPYNFTKSPLNYNSSEYEDDYDDDDYDENTDLRKSLNIMSLIVYSLAFVLGVVGNGIVIWVTGFKMKRTVNTVWFLNLAVADFLFTAFLPLSVAYTAMGFHWPFGQFMCKFNSTLSFLNMFASVYILVVISVDRCVSVVRPIWAQNHRNVSRASVVSFGVWLFALVLSSPYFVFKDTAPDHSNSNIINCFNNFAFSDDYETPEVVELRILRHRAMIITRFIIGFVVPFVIIVSCYVVIIHRLQRNHSMSGRTGRPFKIIAAVITAFFICWAPYHILVLIEMVNHMRVKYSSTLQYVTTVGLPIATSLAFLNSCLNPLLYVFMGQDFKDKVRKSILKVLETAFTEEVSRTNTCTNSMPTFRNKENGSKSFSDAEV
ncbi:chemokine-like receptor 1 [Sinocyclocheilus rhinocerous]|uniref:chemokine-like receptor 1 n=1 Tax=Sinocyclocheilus rhinocerous TaxID=307959 RepID=UPI0007B810AF|nr:PREDICTED: chemokine-like receptor 1 [Sinocyclocheilus rhinocerous]